MVESVRSQWTRQRSGETETPRGSHFAKSGASDSLAAQEVRAEPSLPTLTAQSLPTLDLPRVSVEGSSADDSFANMPPVVQKTSQPVAASQSVASERQDSPQRRVRITGASGEMPVVPLRVKKSPAIPYSRFNKRYLTQGPKMDFGSALGAFAGEPMEGAPAYGWKAFATYGIASVALSIVWCIAVKIAVPGPLSADSFEATLGVVLLCVTVVAGIVLFAVTMSMTRHNVPEYPASDIAASALGKTSLMMVAGVAAWVLASFFVTSVSL